MNLKIKAINLVINEFLAMLNRLKRTDKYRLSQ